MYLCELFIWDIALLKINPKSSPKTIFNPNIKNIPKCLPLFDAGKLVGDKLVLGPYALELLILKYK